ncbi:hypothetical protein M0811_03621 [Anaeramoeba ignava]|uniref:Uncharacterized protein n=1 Tax=Anaeramoeba ignava TaxID=1746090 RepID=A0A9Q0L5G6_ANAIG|nr:hypothetical protein M0811_03621 [Anaeramoeba ignava]
MDSKKTSLIETFTTKKINKKTLKTYQRAIQKTAEPMMIIYSNTKILEINNSCILMLKCISREECLKLKLINFCPDFQPHMKTLSSRAFGYLIPSLIESSHQFSRPQITKFDFKLKDLLNEEFWVEISVAVYNVHQNFILILSFEPIFEPKISYNKNPNNAFSSVNSTMSVVTESCDFTNVEDLLSDVSVDISDLDPLFKDLKNLDIDHLTTSSLLFQEQDIIYDNQNPNQEKSQKENELINQNSFENLEVVEFNLKKDISTDFNLLSQENSSRTNSITLEKKTQNEEDFQFFIFDFLEFQLQETLSQKILEIQISIEKKLDKELEKSIISLINQLKRKFEYYSQQQRSEIDQLLISLHSERRIRMKDFQQFDKILFEKLKILEEIKLENKKLLSEFSEYQKTYSRILTFFKEEKIIQNDIEKVLNELEINNEKF